MPRSRAVRSPEATARGVARPSAQGHETMRTDSPVSRAVVAGAPLAHCQPNATAARTSTSGTNTAAMRSATRWAPG